MFLTYWPATWTNVLIYYALWSHPKPFSEWGYLYAISLIPDPSFSLGMSMHKYTGGIAVNRVKSRPFKTADFACTSCVNFWVIPDPSFSLGMSMHKYNLQTIFTYALIGCCQALVILSLAGLITIYGKVCYPHQWMTDEALSDLWLKLLRSHLSTSCQRLKFCVKKSEFEFVARWHLVCTYSSAL